MIDYLHGCSTLPHAPELNIYMWLRARTLSYGTGLINTWLRYFAVGPDAGVVGDEGGLLDGVDTGVGPEVRPTDEFRSSDDTFIM
jgi:hypothetical protein